MTEDPKRSETSSPGGPIASFLVRHEALALGALLTLAALFRSLRWSSVAVIFNDGPIFIGLGEAVAAGEWTRALHHEYHPLYSILIAGVHALIGDWELSGVAVSVIGGTAAVGCLYGFARSAFDVPTAFAAAAILAVHPYAVEFCGDVQSEGLYLGLFLGAVWALWMGLQSAGFAAALLAGALSGLAYLTRPEGIGLLAVGGAIATWYFLRRSWSRRRAVAWGGLLLLGAACVAGPYVVWLRMETGDWSITQKKAVAWVLGVSDSPAPATGAPAAAPAASEATGASAPSPAEPAAESHESARGEHAARSRLAHYGEAMADLLHTELRAFRPELFAILVAGVLIGRWRRLSLRGVFVALIVGFYGVLLYELAANVGYVSARHALPPLTVALGHVAAALLAATAGLAGSRRRIAVAVILLAVAGIGLSKSLRPDRIDSLAERRSAEWLRAQNLPPGGVATHRSRIAYYAGAPDVRIPSEPFRFVVEEMLKRGASYLIINDEDIDDYPWLIDELPTYARLLHREEAHGVTASVYRLLSRREAAAAAKRPVP